jgi:hypothetical protein
MTMSVLGNVFDSLKAMSLLQLLLAFIACTGYALVQGHLLAPRGRRNAGIAAALAAAGFVFESREWTYAAMLLTFAVAGLGVFVALVWLTSRLLGVARARRQPVGDEVLAEAAAPLGAPRARPAPAAGHAHSTL